MKTITSKTERVSLYCASSGSALVFNRRADGWACTSYTADEAPVTVGFVTLADVRGTTSVHRKLGWHVTFSAGEQVTDLASFDPSKL